MQVIGVRQFPLQFLSENGYFNNNENIEIFNLTIENLWNNLFPTINKIFIVIKFLLSTWTPQ